MSRSLDPQIRAELAKLLERKATESSNPVLTNYLRTVAVCIREHEGARATNCLDPVTHRALEQIVDHKQRGLTPLGEFFARHSSDRKQP